MLAKKNRFHGYNSVSKVKGTRIQTPLFKVFFAINTRRKDFRMAVVVSKKTAKSAVTRNKIRRRLFEAVRKSHILDNQPVDAVFVVNNESFASAKSDDIESSVIKACQQIVKST